MSTITFSFLLNGSVCGNIISSQDLRKGDKILSYLSVVSSMFGWVEVEGREENKIRRGKGKDKGKQISFLCVFGCRREEKVEKGN